MVELKAIHYFDIFLLLIPIFPINSWGNAYQLCVFDESNWVKTGKDDDHIVNALDQKFLSFSQKCKYKKADGQ